MTPLLAALAVMAVSDEPTITPAEHQRLGLALAFERLGHHGTVFLNADGSYLIVQTAPDGRTEPFAGRWTAHGAAGVCIAPETGEGGKCLPRLPQRPETPETITSDRDEAYRLTLRRR